MNLFCISILIFCISINNSFGQKKPKKAHSFLRYDGIYIYDNGIDTIIKDYKAFNELKNLGIFDRYNIVPKDTFTISTNNSKTIIYLLFRKNGNCIYGTGHDDINIEYGYEKLLRTEKKEDQDDIRKYYLMDNDKIFFDWGTTERFFMYNGIMKKDTIIFKLSINGIDIYPYWDSVRVFTFYKYP